MNTNNLISLHNEALNKLNEIIFFNGIDTNYANKLFDEYNHFIKSNFFSIKKNSINSYSVISDVCKEFNISHEDLIQKNRTTNIRYARYTIMYILRNNGFTHDKIADFLKPAITHHSSVIHGIFKINELLSTPNDVYYNLVNSLINKY